ncbi:ParB/RepB/Spo0J family partition protein [Congzhengia minquanensis]|uniref:ParB/RepB/Spo0J family partition protein n=1 Tax=Congzhengia minquanensis TaxID=2763657 RepID=A0A926DLV9_9FIRM|nr:ParB/RepB/Spo0J family partition protein [Congzhengia minquanensis]MBC8541373.1 ParB/RepB/Spo0J family partition protein [Congzhengia minquanensis]
MAKRGLGRGLDALLSAESVVETTTEREKDVKIIKITQIEPNKTQPRSDFDEEKLNSLADSILEYGVLQPIVVKLNSNGFYTIIAGERRWRAARIAKLKEIPAIVKSFDEKSEKEVALIENLQRENLNAVEEALGIKELMDVYGLTQEDVSKKIGKSRSAVANSVRLLNLPDSIKAFIKDGVLSMGHARSILALENENLMNMVAEKIIQEDFSVRQTENYIKSLLVEKKTKTVSKAEEELIRYIKSLEESLSSDLGTKIRIVNKKNKGKIEIPYSSAEDFERIIQLIKK